MPKILRVGGDEIIVDENRAKPTPFHCPSDALQVHCDLLDWIDSEYGYDMTRDIILKYKTEDAWDDDGNHYPATDPNVIEGYRSLLWDAVNHNNTMFVSAHMVDQLEALIPSFEDEPLWLTDLPDEKGTVLFERSIRSVLGVGIRLDEDDVIYGIKGFTYRYVRDQRAEMERNGVLMSIDIRTPGVDDGNETDPRMIAFLQHDGILVWPLFDAGDFFVAENQWEHNGRPPLLPMSFSAQPFGPRVDPGSEDPNDMVQMRQIVVTLFRLIWQHILVEDRPSRPERRRMGRIAAKHKRLPDDGTEIKVRHLRRIEGESGEHEPGEPREGHALTHRIIVRGHPRDQHYPSLGPARVNGQWNPDSHRRIWISAHIRGPEDSPLVLKHALDAVVR